MEKEVNSCWPHTAACSRLPWGCSTGWWEHCGSPASHSGTEAWGTAGLQAPARLELQKTPCNSLQQPSIGPCLCASSRQLVGQVGMPKRGIKALFQGISCRKSLKVVLWVLMCLTGGARKKSTVLSSWEENLLLRLRVMELLSASPAPALGEAAAPALLPGLGSHATELRWHHWGWLWALLCLLPPSPAMSGGKSKTSSVGFHLCL